MTRGMKIGIGFTVVPIVIILVYLGFWGHYVYTESFLSVSEPIAGLKNYTGGVTFKSTVPYGNPTAELLVGAGTCFMSVCYGIAKIIREIRRA
jgi:hypothetical protein